VLGLYYNYGVYVMDRILSTCVDNIFSIRKYNYICNLNINVNIYCPPTFGSPCIIEGITQFEIYCDIFQSIAEKSTIKIE
jgi:hypothetical protein